MKQTININCRASANSLEKKLKEYEKQGWKVISKERGSWWGKIGNSYNWSIILEREDDCPPNNQIRKNEENIVEQLVKLKELLDSNALTQDEYDLLKKRLFK